MSRNRSRSPRSAAWRLALGTAVLMLVGPPAASITSSGCRHRL